jgi:hypothetical protein
MTKGRAALPLSVVAEQTVFFITWGGPKAHNFSAGTPTHLHAVDPAKVHGSKVLKIERKSLSSSTLSGTSTPISALQAFQLPDPQLSLQNSYERLISRLLGSN